MPFTTDDLAQWRARKMAAEAPTPGAEPPDDPAAPIRFTLRELMVAVTVVATLLAVLTQFGILGAVAAFVATSAFTRILYPRVCPTDSRAQALMFDYLWGAGMPVICFVFDPLMFKGNAETLANLDVLLSPAGTIEGAELLPASFLVYPFVGWQIALLIVWLTAGPRFGRWSGLFAGTFVMGAGFAWLVGLVLLIPSIVGTVFFGIGLLGLTPLLTAYVFTRQFRRANAYACAARNEVHPGAPTVLGILASIAIPAVIGWVLLAAFPTGLTF